MKRKATLLFIMLLIAGYARSQNLVADSMVVQPELSKDGKYLYVNYIVKNIGTKDYYGFFIQTKAIFNGNTKDTSSDGYGYVLYGGKLSEGHSVQIYTKITVTDSAVLKNPAASSIVIIWPTGNGVSTTPSNNGIQTSAYTSYSGISQNDAIHDYIKISPMPAIDILHIQYNDPRAVIKNISIADISGKIIATYQNPASDLDISGFGTGLYFLTVQFTNGEAARYKIIKAAKQ